MTIGDQIKAVRKKRSLTQQQLGDRLGVSGSLVGQYETGKRIPKRETLQKLAIALDVPQTELLPSDTIDLFDLIGDPSVDYTPYKVETELFSARQQKITDALFKLNDEGQSVAVERIEELTCIPKYQK